jgi:hypothetical protein
VLLLLFVISIFILKLTFDDVSNTHIHDNISIILGCGYSAFRHNHNILLLMAKLLKGNKQFCGNNI